MKEFLKKQSVRIITGFSVISVLINAIGFYFFPLLSTDSTWTLSSFYDYLKNPKSETSNYAHEYLGSIFNFNTLHFVLGPIFKVIDLNTTNFIILHFVIIVLTAIIIRLLVRNKFVASIVVLFYVTDSYIYGFRSESYNLLFGVLLMSIWKFTGYRWIKIIPAVLIVCFVGFLHPVGGILLLLTYLFLLYQDASRVDTKKQFQFRYFILSLIFSGCLAGLILYLNGFDKVFNLVTAYMTTSGDTENHFVGIDLGLMMKYLIFGSSFWVFLMGLSLFQGGNRDFLVFNLFFLVFLLFSGRSYYYTYLIIPVLLYLSSKENAIFISKIFKDFSSVRLITTLLLTGSLGLTIARLDSSFRSRNAGLLYRKVLKASAEIVSGEGKQLVFLPSQLSIENAYSSNQRIIYRSVRMTRKPEVAKGTSVLLFNTDQFNWIEKNPNVFGDLSKWQVDTVIPFSEGVYGLLSNIRSSSKPVYYFGLVRYTKISD